MSTIMRTVGVWCAGSARGLQVLCYVSTWAEERITTDLDTSTIMRTVGVWSAGSISGLQVLCYVSTWAEERITTDLDTSTIMHTVGSVVCMFRWWSAGSLLCIYLG